MAEITYLQDKTGVTDAPTALKRIGEQDVEQALIFYVIDGTLMVEKVNVSPMETVYFMEFAKMNELLDISDDD